MTTEDVCDIIFAVTHQMPKTAIASVGWGNRQLRKLVVITMTQEKSIPTDVELWVDTLLSTQDILELQFCDSIQWGLSYGKTRKCADF